MQWDDIPPVVSYLYVSAPAHPLASKRGWVALHRWLVYRRLGAGPHACHWCGISVHWPTDGEDLDALVVDHVDRNRGNNEDDNLVPSCVRCNLARRGDQVPRQRSPRTAIARLPGRGLRGPETARFEAQVTVTDTCWLWAGAAQAPGRYGRFLTDHGYVRAHRYAWRRAAGADPSPILHVLHTCDTPYCVRADDPGIYVVDGIAYPRFGHLWLGTHGANMADKRRKARASRTGAGAGQVRGERSASAKLTESDVLEIRRLLEDGHTLRGIAARFGVSKGPITGISRGVLWKHVH